QASQPAPQTEAARPGRSACDRAHFHTVIDVGHTESVPGARSARAVPEYEYNLRLAKEIEQKLLGAGFAKTTLLITADPPPAGLFLLANRVNKLGADLLLSIHHDSVPDQFLEKWEYEGEEYSFSDRFKGHSLFVSFDNPERKASIWFARLLGRELRARG